ncbi:MAG: 4Fe-4S domain-containing protein [Jatrophihabitantaceae bacterium]
MARLDQEHPLDARGDWFVDTRCIGCDVARQWAPGLIAEDDDALSFIARQPENAEEELALWRAAEACPTQSIGKRSSHRPPAAVFPVELTPGVLALGHNSEDSFGAHSYLVRRSGGNVMVDSPRFLRSLAEARRLGVEDVLHGAGAHTAPAWKRYVEGVGDAGDIPAGMMIPGCRAGDGPGRGP